MTGRAGVAIGETLLGYRLEAIVRRGGMGVVYQAYDPRLKRRVAIKLVAPELSADPRFRQRFLAEAEIAASLEHPNVIPIHDAGEIDGRLFLVMRFVEGGDLETLLARQRRLEPARAVGICSQLAAALDAAHGRGLVHGDVKPSNVLLDEGEHAYLADFGLSWTARGRVGDDSLLGTPSYVAPEQIRGESVSDAADQYALACLLYACLTGRPPFDDRSLAGLLFAHLELVPSLQGTKAREPLARGMAKDPRARYPSCRALVDSTAKALGAGASTRRPRRRLVAAILGAVVAVPAAGALVISGLAGESASAPTVAGGAKVVRVDPRSPREQRRVPVGADPIGIAVGSDAIWVASMGSGTLERLDPASGEVTEAIGVAAEQLGPTSLTVTPPGTLVDTANHLRGELVWIGDTAQGRLRPYDSAVGRVLTEAITYPSFDCTFTPVPDQLTRLGRRLWFAASSGLIGLDLQTGAQTSIRLSQSVLAVTSGRGKLWIVEFGSTPVLARIDPTRRVVERRRDLAFIPSALTVAAGGVWVAAIDSDEVWRFDPHTLRPVAHIRVGATPTALTYGGGAIWSANAVAASVSRIDVDRNRLADTVGVGSEPHALAFGHGALWVATAPPAEDSAEQDC